jgi:hypothetical protein
MQTQAASTMSGGRFTYCRRIEADHVLVFVALAILVQMSAFAAVAGQTDFSEERLRGSLRTEVASEIVQAGWLSLGG